MNSKIPWTNDEGNGLCIRLYDAYQCLDQTSKYALINWITCLVNLKYVMCFVCHIQILSSKKKLCYIWFGFKLYFSKLDIIITSTEIYEISIISNSI